MSKKKKGIRYSDDTKREAVEFIAAQGRGGLTAASKKFGVSSVTLSRWRNDLGGKKPAKKTSIVAPRPAATKPTPAAGDSQAALKRMIAINQELGELRAEYENLKASV